MEDEFEEFLRMCKSPEPEPDWQYKNGRISLKVHGQTFLEQLRMFYSTSAYCDVTLEIGTCRMQAHKLVLAANSDYFKAMFSSAWSEASKNVVALKGITPTGMRALLDFCYIGEFEISEENVGEILEAARYTFMPKVTELCEAYLDGFVAIRSHNHYDIYHLAKSYNLKTLLRSSCLVYFMGIPITSDLVLLHLDYARFCNSEEVLRKVRLFILKEHAVLIFHGALLEALNPDDISALISESGKFGDNIDRALVEFIIRWIESSPKERIPYLGDFFTKINLAALVVEDLDHIAEMTLVKDSPECQMRIQDVKDYLAAAEAAIVPSEQFLVTLHVQKEHCVTFRSLGEEVPAVRSLTIPYTEDRIKGASLIVHKNVLYILCTFENSSASKVPFRSVLYSYDPTRNKWKVLPGLATPTQYNALLFLDNKLYSIGGVTFGTNQGLNSVEAYNFEENAWEPLPALPFRHPCPLAAVLDGFIYVSFDGAGSALIANEFFRLKPGESNNWSKRATSPMTSCHSLVATEDRLYLCGNDWKGLDRDTMRMYSYNPGRNSWLYMPKDNEYGLFQNVHTQTFHGQIYMISNLEKTQYWGDGDDEEAAEEEDDVGVFIFDQETASISMKTSFQFEHEMTSAGILSVPLRTVPAIEKEPEGEPMDLVGE